jgi:hypothetical protein
MQVRFDLVEQDHDARGRLLAELRRCDEVLSPGPRQHVGQRRDAPRAERRVENRHVLAIAHANRRDIAGVIDRKPRESRSRLQRAVPDRRSKQGKHGRHALRVHALDRQERSHVMKP